jgi:SSS family solute:Na+ symporter
MFFIATFSAIFIYVSVSFLSSRIDFNLDKLLHRGKYAIDDDQSELDRRPAHGLRSLIVGKEFTLSDKIIYYCVTIAWPMTWFSVFVVVTTYNFFVEVPYESWMSFWKFFIHLIFSVSVIFVIWVCIGGIGDLKTMFRTLAVKERDAEDDGIIRRQV